MVNTITDMFNRIKNAQMVKKPTVLVPFSGINYEIGRLLAERGFIDKVEKKGKKIKKFIEIALKYTDKVPAISGIKTISKPGQRIYISSREIKPVKGGYGMAIISTSKGVMTDKEARKQKLGGELICQVW